MSHTAPVHAATPRPRARHEAPPDSALVLLMHDHREVEALFKRYEVIKDHPTRGEKTRLVQEACRALMIHTEIEEKLLYPAARRVLDETDLVEEAGIEHESIKLLIARIETMKANSPKYDAVFKVISEYVAHHVREEEEELFPKLRRAGLDTQALANEMRRYRERLMTRFPPH
ncbi:hemerythrin domain-containing protein [Niveibacterium sp. SC-1]|uniref:hemerythrin domain-containing protein n=1 Tax=Niveibacterium sp. SC-1 TaxID=3135646 RepID=UPI00311F4D9D